MRTYVKIWLINTVLNFTAFFVTINITECHHETTVSRPPLARDNIPERAP